MLGTIHVDKTFYKFNWPALMIFSFVFYYFLSNDNILDAIEGTSFGVDDNLISNVDGKGEVLLRDSHLY